MKCSNKQCDGGLVNEEVCGVCGGTGEGVIVTTEAREAKEGESSTRSAIRDPQSAKSESEAPEIPQSSAKKFSPLAPGIHIYLGTTGVGKTYKAWAECLATHAAEKRTVLVIDSGGAENFKEYPHAKDLREAVSATWADKPALVFYTPKSDSDFEAIMRACREVGNVILFIDELSFWTGSSEFKLVCRMWRHARLTILGTCQIVGGDLGQYLLGCNPTLYIFRVSAPRSLEWVMRWHGLDPDEIRALPDRQYLTKHF